MSRRFWLATLVGVTAVLSPLEEAIAMNRSRAPIALPIDDVDRRFKPGFYRQMRTFVEMVRSGAPPPAPAADLADALASMQLAAWLAGDEVQLQ